MNDHPCSKRIKEFTLKEFLFINYEFLYRVYKNETHDPHEYKNPVGVLKNVKSS